MSSLTQRTPKVKPVRTVRVAVGPSEDNPYSIIVIRQGNTWDDYAVKRLPSDFGAAYSVEKTFNGDGTVYHVHLSDDGAMSCECKGHLRWGHCKHAEALLALRQAGKL
jgi:hypothetical protein